jgi:hypothetical protein
MFNLNICVVAGFQFIIVYVVRYWGEIFCTTFYYCIYLFILFFILFYIFMVCVKVKVVGAIYPALRGLAAYRYD